MLAGDCAGTNPYSGQRYFAVGGLCEESPVGRMHQDIDVTEFADSIDAGGMSVTFGAMMSDWSGVDVPDMRLQFEDQNGNEISSTEYIAGAQTTWLLIEQLTTMPPLTRTIRCELRGTRSEGTDNDSYFDDIVVRIGNEIECDPSIVNVDNTTQRPLKFNAYPNPATDKATIELPYNWGTETIIRIADVTGKKIDAEYKIENSKLYLHRSSLNSGAYTITIINGSLWGSTVVIFE